MLRPYIPVLLLLVASILAAGVLLVYTKKTEGQMVAVFAPSHTYMDNHLAVSATNLRIVRKGGMRFILVVDAKNDPQASEKLKKAGALFTMPAIIEGGCFYLSKA